MNLRDFSGTPAYMFELSEEKELQPRTVPDRKRHPITRDTVENKINLGAAGIGDIIRP